MSEFRIIFHEPVCPDCGSNDTTTEDVPTGDGLCETAHICADCGAAWPMACIAEWTNPSSTPHDSPAPQHFTRR